MTEEISPATRRVRYDVSDETYAVVRRLYNGEEVDVPDHVLAEIEGVYGPLEWFKWYMEALKTEFEKRVLGDVENWKPTGILSMPAVAVVESEDRHRSPIFAALETRVGKPPPALRAEPVADRVRRDLVPLVRAAAAEVPLRLSVPPIDPLVISRPHQRGEHCWCRPWLIGSTVTHRDDNVPVPSDAWMLADTMLAERLAVDCRCVTCGPRPAGTCSY